MIINNIADLSKYIEISPSADAFRLYEPSIRTAERRFILPVLGKEQHAALITAAAGPDEMQGNMFSLYQLTQEALANLAMALAVSRLTVDINDAGISRPESDSKKTAYQYQEINLRESYVRAGFDAINDMLQLLEDHVADFEPWALSIAHKEYKRFFIQSGSRFNDVFTLRNAHFTYLAIRPIMRKVEDFDVLPVLGKQLFAKLKAGLFDGNLSEKYQALIADYIKPAVAQLTMARAVFEKAVDVTDFGVTINIIQDNSNSQQKQAAPLDKIKEVSLQLRADGQQYLSMLDQELTANPGDYPDYEAPSEEQALFNITNKQDNSFLAV